MDKIKEKLEKLRIESDANNSRAERAENEVKELKAELAKRDTEVQNMKNKVTLLEMDLERTEKRVEEVIPFFFVCFVGTHERKAKQIDNEKIDLEKKYEELNAKYLAVKSELDATLKSLEDL
ncbi:hypothetical protein BC829DRAFT_380332 [Chytridium lagenaria]|nr:hypothetical protein BC829DRAFT_380332 [Chytridium lagenaria]